MKSSNLYEKTSKLSYVETVRERIKRIRKTKGMTQQHLAQKTNVTRAAVAQWESGDTKELKAENVLNCADALGVSVRYLITGRPEETDLRTQEGRAVYAINPIAAHWHALPHHARATIWMIANAALGGVLERRRHIGDGTEKVYPGKERRGIPVSPATPPTPRQRLRDEMADLVDEVTSRLPRRLTATQKARMVEALCRDEETRLEAKAAVEKAAKNAITEGE